MPDKKKAVSATVSVKESRRMKERKKHCIYQNNGTWTEHINQHRETETNKTVMIIMFYIQTNKTHTHTYTHFDTYANKKIHTLPCCNNI